MVEDLPQDLSPYKTIWHIAERQALSADDRTRLADFVSSGKGLYLTGEETDSCSECAALNGSVEALLDTLVVGGATLSGTVAMGNTFTFNSAAAGGITQSPNVLTNITGNGAGQVAVSGENILITSSNAAPVGAVWECADLTGGRGRIVLVMDSTWIVTNPLAVQSILENFEAFLTSAESCQ